MESTATGMEAETVMPTLSTRYIELAPKRIPSSAPTRTGRKVSSGGCSLAGTKGLCSASACRGLAMVEISLVRGAARECGIDGRCRARVKCAEDTAFGGTSARKSACSAGR